MEDNNKYQLKVKETAKHYHNVINHNRNDDKSFNTLFHTYLQLQVLETTGVPSGYFFTSIPRLFNQLADVLGIATSTLNDRLVKMNKQGLIRRAKGRFYLQSRKEVFSLLGIEKYTSKHGKKYHSFNNVNPNIVLKTTFNEYCTYFFIDKKMQEAEYKIKQQLKTNGITQKRIKYSSNKYTVDNLNISLQSIVDGVVVINNKMTAKNVLESLENKGLIVIDKGGKMIIKSDVSPAEYKAFKEVNPKAEMYSYNPYNKTIWKYNCNSYRFTTKIKEVIIEAVDGVKKTSKKVKKEVADVYKKLEKYFKNDSTMKYYIQSLKIAKRISKQSYNKIVDSIVKMGGVDILHSLGIEVAYAKKLTKQRVYNKWEDVTIYKFFVMEDENIDKAKASHWEFEDDYGVYESLFAEYKAKYEQLKQNVKNISKVEYDGVKSLSIANELINEYNQQ